MKKIVIMAVLAALIISLSACGSAPAATTTPTPTATPDVTAPEWQQVLNAGALKDETILDDEHIARVEYDGKLIGYLADDAGIVKTLKSICDQYMASACTYNYTTVNGREEWYLFSDAYFKKCADSQIDQQACAYCKDQRIVAENQGISQYIDILINADGMHATISFIGKVKFTGGADYLKKLNADKNGIANFPITLKLIKETGTWKIDDILYDDPGQRPALQKVQ